MPDGAESHESGDRERFSRITAFSRDNPPSNSATRDNPAYRLAGSRGLKPPKTGRRYRVGRPPAPVRQRSEPVLSPTTELLQVSPLMVAPHRVAAAWILAKNNGDKNSSTHYHWTAGPTELRRRGAVPRSTPNVDRASTFWVLVAGVPNLRWPAF